MGICIMLGTYSGKKLRLGNQERLLVMKKDKYADVCYDIADSVLISLAFFKERNNGEQST